MHCTQDDLLDALLRQGRLDGVIGAFISERWVAGLPGRPLPLVNVGGMDFWLRRPQPVSWLRCRRRRREPVWLSAGGFG